MSYDTRADLLRQALRLFAMRGYDAVGVQEIVQETGVTKPTLYHYFGSKRGLLEAVLQKHFDELTATIEEVATYQHDITLTLHRIIAAFFDFARSRPLFFQLQLALFVAPPESQGARAVQGHHERLFRIIERMFIAAVPDHGNMRGRHTRYALTLLGMINNYITLWLNGYTDLDDLLVHDAAHQFMHGIFS